MRALIFRHVRKRCERHTRYASLTSWFSSTAAGRRGGCSGIWRRSLRGAQSISFNRSASMAQKTKTAPVQGFLRSAPFTTAARPSWPLRTSARAGRNNQNPVRREDHANTFTAETISTIQPAGSADRHWAPELSHACASPRVTTGANSRPSRPRRDRPAIPVQATPGRQSVGIAAPSERHTGHRCPSRDPRITSTLLRTSVEGTNMKPSRQPTSNIGSQIVNHHRRCCARLVSITAAG